jgi:hypothetical protein
MRITLLPGGRKFCQKAQIWLGKNEVAGETLLKFNFFNFNMKSVLA